LKTSGRQNVRVWQTYLLLPVGAFRADYRYRTNALPLARPLPRRDAFVITTMRAVNMTLRWRLRVQHLRARATGCLRAPCIIPHIPLFDLSLLFHTDSPPPHSIAFPFSTSPIPRMPLSTVASLPLYLQATYSTSTRTAMTFTPHLRCATPLAVATDTTSFNFPMPHAAFSLAFHAFSLRVVREQLIFIAHGATTARCSAGWRCFCARLPPPGNTSCPYTIPSPTPSTTASCAQCGPTSASTCVVAVSRRLLPSA